MDERRWLCHTGELVTRPADALLTMYDGLNHTVAVWDDGALGQMLTTCGKRACPGPTREVPGRGPVDCPECLAAIGEADHG